MVDFAARAVPNLAPDPKVVDEAPLVREDPPAWFSPGGAQRGPLLGVGALLLLLGTTITGAAAVASPIAQRLAARARDEGAAVTTEPLLAAHGVTKRYGARAVLDDFTLGVERGQAVALWGGNGAGKTTAIRCLLGLVHCEGEVVVDGHSLRRDPKAVRRRMGYVPQDAQLPDLPARDVLRLFAALRGVPQADVQATAELVGIHEHLAKRPAELSGGLRQRLALALALLGTPPLLLLDEPTANLDPATRRSLFELISTMRDRGTTVLFTTHRAEEVVAFADRVVTLDDGRTTADQPVAAFARDLHGEANELLVRVAPDDLDRARGLLEQAGFAVVARAGWLVLTRVAPDRPLRVLWEAGIEVRESATGGAMNGGWG
jgi:ABC-type multidrug transport system ATPase subunit